MDGRLKVAIDNENDFAFFAELLQDAMGDSGAQCITEQIVRNETDEDWEEFVKPDLLIQFKQEILNVSETLSAAQEEELKEFFIENDTAQDLYSTLNQARLNIENVYKLSELPEDLDGLTLPMQEASAKYELYTQIQSIILQVLEF